MLFLVAVLFVAVPALAKPKPGDCPDNAAAQAAMKGLGAFGSSGGDQNKGSCHFLFPGNNISGGIGGKHVSCFGRQSCKAVDGNGEFDKCIDIEGKVVEAGAGSRNAERFTAFDGNCYACFVDSDELVNSQQSGACK